MTALFLVSSALHFIIIATGDGTEISLELKQFLHYIEFEILLIMANIGIGLKCSAVLCCAAFR